MIANTRKLNSVLKDIIDCKIHVALIYTAVSSLINLVLHNDLCSDSLSNNYTAFNFCYTNALPNTYICALLNKIVKCCVSIIVLVYKLVLNVKSYVTVFVNCEFQELLFS